MPRSAYASLQHSLLPLFVSLLFNSHPASAEIETNVNLRFYFEDNSVWTKNVAQSESSLCTDIDFPPPGPFKAIPPRITAIVPEIHIESNKVLTSLSFSIFTGDNAEFCYANQLYGYYTLQLPYYSAGWNEEVVRIVDEYGTQLPPSQQDLSKTSSHASNPGSISILHDIEDLNDHSGPPDSNVPAIPSFQGFGTSANSGLSLPAIDTLPIFHLLSGYDMSPRKPQARRNALVRLPSFHDLPALQNSPASQQSANSGPSSGPTLGKRGLPDPDVYRRKGSGRRLAKRAHSGSGIDSPGTGSPQPLSLISLPPDDQHGDYDDADGLTPQGMLEFPVIRTFPAPASFVLNVGVGPKVNTAEMAVEGDDDVVEEGDMYAYTDEEHDLVHQMDQAMSNFIKQIYS
ncbi:hypothetical protein DRE_06695 [Drechslerella stenobrocha 248]|uniref:Uncharacterized protein n=1 Tax=Drechslerella stenobrocha 248 TaxID=1043628 RepID=W7HXA4_9PEZI|nr:hypothetical protein DRE_06695 [Drechslerella stenobrocha 248]